VAPSGGLAQASGSVPTIAGPVVVSWHRRGRTMALNLAVPANAVALVHLPATGTSSVRESGQAAGRAPGVSVSSVANGVAVLSVGSGSYRFTTE